MSNLLKAIKYYALSLIIISLGVSFSIGLLQFVVWGFPDYGLAALGTIISLVAVPIVIIKGVLDA